ncbi:aromatic-ring-hydroxylating dioxygenase subunit beta [Capillimicrobium parvum]|uniref:3-phenylpropionate/cinnamic acid dioxygenase subunit beta n=1 Tax=Capillimicrobium parvum TaxID=2884022 RepID=A0A9E6XSB5_9ACTN|nr:aromatic-ring-hydroxylating dioxygenase subunit beta [Capillimicrobium parvum]UGS33849.1 3-phenylpropionate/cinnamic acid dioxygenase subunit beta [Capillimicrobium parvum]
MAAELNDPSRYSTYVDPEFYAALARHTAELDEPAAPVDAATRDACAALLYREARLLDEGRLEDWLELFVPECLYWMPMTPGGGEPTTEVTLAFDDRRRLEDRIAWLRSAYIWSQIPRSRTRRSITNIEVVQAQAPGELLVRSNFVVHDVRPGYHATFPGWTAHRLRAEGDSWLIAIKQVNLLDSDQAHQNLSIIF